MNISRDYLKKAISEELKKVLREEDVSTSSPAAQNLLKRLSIMKNQNLVDEFTQEQFQQLYDKQGAGLSDKQKVQITKTIFGQDIESFPATLKAFIATINDEGMETPAVDARVDKKSIEFIKFLKKLDPNTGSPAVDANAIEKYPLPTQTKEEVIKMLYSDNTAAAPKSVMMWAFYTTMAKAKQTGKYTASKKGPRLK